jgi:hypothetical protein
MRSIGNQPIDALVVPGGGVVEDVTRDRAHALDWEGRCADFIKTATQAIFLMGRP